MEDKAVSDATTNLTIDPNLRASASIIARQEMVVAGLGAVPRFLEIFARLDPRPAGAHAIRGGQPSGDLRRRARARGPGAGGDSPQRARAAELRARDPEPDAAPERHCHADAPVCRRDPGHEGARARHAQDRAGACARWRSTRCCAAAAPIIASICASGILIKNNHISLGGGLRTALTHALEQRKQGQRVQVEVRTQQELEEALECGAEAILLDNMTPAQVKECGRTHSQGESAGFRPRRRAALCSTTFAPMPRRASDFISVGALTHSAKAADISMTHCCGAELDRVRPGRARGRTCRHNLCGQAAFFCRSRIDQHRCAGGSARWGAAWLGLLCR